MTDRDIAAMLAEAERQAEQLRAEARYYDGRAAALREILDRLRGLAQTTTEPEA